MTLVEGLDEALIHAHRRQATSVDDAIGPRVRDILSDVRTRGDEALVEYARRLDGVEIGATTLDVQAAFNAAPALEPDLQHAIDLAIRRVRAYYGHQVSRGFVTHHEGVTLGQVVRPLDSVGVYVPGGTATLFTSLIMTAVPAQVAGVPRVVAATPPQAGGVAPEVLYVAHALGIEQLVLAGGAQAVGALAYGTSSIQAVDKIGGPGNAYVVEAMRQLFGTVGIVSLPGPTETLVMAAPDADPADVAADLLAQAEHAESLPALVTWSKPLVQAVVDAAREQLEGVDQDARTRAGDAMDERFVAYVVAGQDEALQVANAFAPEHLCFHVADPWSLIERIQHAGGVFMGADTLEALGDYLLGPSHVMPTGRTARFSSFVNTRDFERVIPFAEVGPDAIESLGPNAVRMAEQEGLPFHANAVRRRLKRS